MKTWNVDVFPVPFSGVVWCWLSENCWKKETSVYPNLKRNVNKTWNTEVFPVLFSGVAQCSGTSRTVCHAPWPPSNGRAALCPCTAKTTPTSCSTCAALSAASCPSAAPRTRSSRTGTECGICRMRYVPVVWEFVASRDCNVPVVREFVASRDCSVRGVQGWKPRKRKRGCGQGDADFFFFKLEKNTALYPIHCDSIKSLGGGGGYFIDCVW